MAIFKGAGVAIVTPFFEDGTTNYKKLEELLDYQIESGTDAIVICGTTGEASTLSEEEHIKVIEYTCDYVNKRVPVIAGTGSNCTDTAIYLSTEAEKAGADGVLLVTPYYNKATQKGLYEHYKQTADKLHIPAILYNVPSRTGCNILPQTAAKLVKEVDQIVGIKEATGDVSHVARLMEMTQGDIDLYSGNDDQIVPLLSLGGIGVISVLSNIMPKEAHDICQKWFDGDVKGSRDLQVRLVPLIDALFCEVNPIPVKEAMNLLGWEVGPFHLPLTPMEENHKQLLISEMKKVGLLS